MSVSNNVSAGVFRVSVLLLLCLVGFGQCDKMYQLSGAFIQKINTVQMTWKAGRNFRADAPVELIRALVGPSTPSGECRSCAAGLACTIAKVTGKPRICEEALLVTGVVGGGAVAVGGAAAVGGVAVVGGVALTALAAAAGVTALTLVGIAGYFLIRNKLPILAEIALHIGIIHLPIRFDVREKWPHCGVVINDVRDTGIAATTWAVAVSQAIADRYCIKHEGTIILFSIKQLLDCCAFCGQRNCEGGSAIAAYQYFYEYGLPSGGAFDYRGPRDGCKPYSIMPMKPCLFDGNCTCCVKQTESACTSKCTNPIYDRGVEVESYKIADYFFQSEDMVDFFSGNRGIKCEIYLRGSVTATVLVYDDFLNYKIGVYFPTKAAKPFGQITVRIIGWGSEGGVQYWLAANSWGRDWGDDGFVKLMANDEIMRLEQGFSVGRVEAV